MPPHKPAVMLTLFLALMPFGPGTGIAQAVDETDTSDTRDGLSLIEEGARLFLRGLMDEFGPLLEDLEGMIDDLAMYHPPEVLPNGDIILRRREPLVPEPTPEDGTEPAPGEEVDI